MQGTMLSVYFALIALLCGGYAVDAISAYRIAAPVFAFSNQEYFPSADRRVAASYQVHDDIRTVIYNIVRKAVHTEHAAPGGWLDTYSVEKEGPEVVLVVMGSQVKTSDLSSSTLQHVLQPLHLMLSQAKSAVTAPYVLHEVDASCSIVSSTLKELASSTVDVFALGSGESSHEGLTDALKRLGSKPAVLSLCIRVDSSIAGTPEGIAAELQQLQDVQRTVAALDKRQITIYATQPEVTGEQQRRQLQAANDDVGVCGPLCQTQVKWLEGILAALVLTLAAFSGMCCLYMLDTPTRFEKPKDGARTD